MRNKISANALQELKKILPAARILVNAPLGEYTTFKIGGLADCLVFPAQTEEVRDILQVAQKYDLPVSVLGNGSNVLVLDGGIRGLVLKFNDQMSYVRQEGNKIIAGAGALLSDICHFAARCGLAGLEFAVGIPGSAGGAVFMNAGAYESEMSRVVGAVTAVDAAMSLCRFEAEELKFSYRHSIFQENKAVICEVEFHLKEGSLPAIFRSMDDFTGKREAKQPLEMASAGSTFKRPPGYFAGTLIEQAGLKGLKSGGAQVSLKHAGFIVNAGGAKAQDVLDLIEEVKNRVYENSGVLLTPEVRIMGEM
jgi:UDP-N-acetylmuramate dehydrogenase